MLATIGGRFGGWTLWLDDSKPRFAYVLSNQPVHKFPVASQEALAPGNHVIRVVFRYVWRGIGKAADVTLLADEKPVGQRSIPQTATARFSLDETLDVGQDTGTPVVEDYAGKMPYEFIGTLKKLGVVLDPEKLTDEERTRLREALSKALMANQ